MWLSAKPFSPWSQTVFLKTHFARNILVITLASCAGSLQASAQAAPKRDMAHVSLEQFPTAETHLMMQSSIDNLDCFGDWGHLRGFTPMDKQFVVRMNRDTLYSGIVLDLTHPAKITKPDIGNRYQSLLVINEGNFAREVFYEPGEYELTADEMGSRYVAVIGRTLVDADDPIDLAKAHEAQDGLKVTQKDKGRFEVPNWDSTDLGNIREALKVLGNYLPSRDTSYGATMEDVDPIAHLIGTADAWGGWHPKNAVYQNYVPRKNDGKTPYQLTLNEVPAGESGFWSISVYNESGFFEQNEFDKYIVNSRKAVIDEDGGVTVYFGGNPNQPNFLPIMPGWNYILRIYLPQASYFDGSWNAPDAQLAE
jgi:hypothetical protein